jgi:hypothetical protein
MKNKNYLRILRAVADAVDAGAPILLSGRDSTLAAELVADGYLRGRALPGPLDRGVVDGISVQGREALQEAERSALEHAVRVAADLLATALAAFGGALASRLA